MKIPLLAFAGAAAVGCATAANLRSSRAHAETLTLDEGHRVVDASFLQSQVSTEAALLTTEVLAGKTGLGQAFVKIHDRMPLKEAVRRLEGKLPQSVAALLKMKDSDAPTFTEESMEKARKILNKMVEDSYEELDNVLIECKAFENANRMSFSQLVTDLGRLGSELADTEEKITEKYSCIGQMDREYKTVEGDLERERGAYEKEKAENDAELTLRKNDLAVFNFILDITKCTDAGFFVQEAAAGNASTPINLCSTQSGVELQFADPKVHSHFEKILTPGARQIISEALGSSFQGKLPGAAPSALLQVKEDTTATTTTLSLGVTAAPTPVQEAPSSASWRKCTGEPPNCGLLHDTMSLQWGKFKDLVDELQAEMDKNKDAWETKQADLNDQMDVIAGQKSECQTDFDAATGARNTLTTESNEKTVSKHELTVQYESHMAVCHARIEELLFTDVCAVRSVRNAVVGTSSVFPPSKITDCDVSDWVAERCSVPCDNSCPHRVGGQIDPYACGGTQMLTRTVVVMANEYGIQCPALQKQTRCGQYKCAVDCMMSEWSGWSKCTKECGGGARSRTRSILTKPNHGGKFCDAPLDAEPCHTDSCDRDCTLDDWTAWSPCSMACNPGNMPGRQERVRKVLVPDRGEGTCPDPTNALRHQDQTCNEQACLGDEICIAKQDLIIAIDASGSLRESGFEIIRDFAANLTGNYRPKYFAEEGVNIGVIVFGNGARLDDGTLSPALNVQPLTADLAAVKETIEGTTWQKGFTNMAQAFVLADVMFQQGGRAEAQSAVLVLSDGKYSFAFQTEQAVNKLKDKGTMVYMAPIAERAGDWQHKLKEWASQPWETNYELLPGLSQVKYNMGLFSSVLVAKFCPKAISLSLMAAQDWANGYMKLTTKKYPASTCAYANQVGWVDSAADCLAMAQAKYPGQTHRNGFGVRFDYLWKGQMLCHSFAFWKVTNEEEFYEWVSSGREDIECPGGYWLNNPSWDIYAIRPVAA